MYQVEFLAFDPFAHVMVLHVHVLGVAVQFPGMADGPLSVRINVCCFRSKLHAAFVAR